MSETSDFSREVLEYQERARQTRADDEIARATQAQGVEDCRAQRAHRNALFIGTDLEAIWTYTQAKTAYEFLGHMATRRYPNSYNLSSRHHSIVGYLIGVAPATRDIDPKLVGQADNAYLCIDGVIRIDSPDASRVGEPGADDFSAMPGCLYDDVDGNPIAPITGVFSYEGGQKLVVKRETEHHGSHGGGNIERVYTEHMRTLEPFALPENLLFRMAVDPSIFVDLPKMRIGVESHVITN